MIDPVLTALIIAYTLLMLAVGLRFIHGQDGAQLFYLGGRTLGPLAVAGTLVPTFLGTGIVFTLAAFGYQYGVGALLLPVAAAIGFALFAWTAPRIKALSDAEDAITLPALMAPYWEPRTRLVAALITAGLFAATLAANLVAAGNVLTALVGIPVRPSIVAFGGLVIVYTVVGGFSGVVWTDFVQLGLIVATVGLILPGVFLLESQPLPLGDLPPGHLTPLSLPPGILVAYLFIGIFAFFGSQDMFQRVYAARGSDEARRGVLVFAGLVVGLASIAVTLGILTSGLHPAIAPDRALLALTQTIDPPEAVGIVLLGFLAMTSSDVDSQLLTVTSNVTQDLLPQIDRVPADRSSVSLERITTTVIGGIALLLAVSVPDLTALFSAVGSWFSMLGFVVIATLYWDGMTDTAALAGLTIGFLAPLVFVAVTGTVQPAMLVGLGATIVSVALTAILTAESG